MESEVRHPEMVQMQLPYNNLVNHPRHSYSPNTALLYRPCFIIFYILGGYTEVPMSVPQSSRTLLALFDMVPDFCTSPINDRNSLDRKATLHVMLSRDHMACS